ncbi:MAG: TetR/AcrR family transcriptional regulator [Lewinellaceae bacterium]|nr:TetR/AcrR family transcriptional regulator [Lewinellaceae bacterium]
MKTTKERIIETALELLNEKGMANVSMRDIADALEISVGNLTYHFPKWQDLMDEIYHQMMHDISAFPRVPFSIAQLNKVFFGAAEVQDRYIFIIGDIHYFTNLYPTYERLRNTLVVARIEDMIRQLGYWANEGLVFPDSEEHPHRLLAQHMWLVMASWGAQNHLLRETPYRLSHQELVKIIWHIFLPHMTEAGRAEYAQLGPLYSAS